MFKMFILGIWNILGILQIVSNQETEAHLILK